MPTYYTFVLMCEGSIKGKDSFLAFPQMWLKYNDDYMSLLSLCRGKKHSKILIGVISQNLHFYKISSF